MQPPESEAMDESAQTRQDNYAAIGLDMVTVAESHVLLFNSMKDFLHGEPVEATWADLIGKGKSCDLGLWIENEGKSHFGNILALGGLCVAHEEFHRSVEGVLEKLQIGSWIEAERARKNELSHSLRRVLIALTEFNEAIRKRVGTKIN
jgi:hypothetical protein